MLAVLGSRNVDAGVLADAMRTQWPQFAAPIGFDPIRLMTGCAEAGVEKAARLAAKSITGKLAVVFHRAEVTYGKKPADEMMASLIAQEADALLILTTGKPICAFARSRFIAWNKKVYEIEIS